MTVNGDEVLLLIDTRLLMTLTHREIAVQEDRERCADRRPEPMSLPDPLVNFGGDWLLIKDRVWSVCEAVDVGVQVELTTCDAQLLVQDEICLMSA